jgi:hypothetical protein
MHFNVSLTAAPLSPFAEMISIILTASASGVPSDIPLVPREFFTTESFGTLAGCTGIVFVVCNGLQRALNFNPRWLALVVSLVVSLLGVYMSGRDGAAYIVGTLNGFLIYCTAVGGSAIVAERPNQRLSALGARELAGPVQARRKFNSPWW